MPAVYKIKCSANNKVYIGSTINPVIRWRTHKYFLKKGTHCSKILQNSWNNYGKESFSFEVLESVDLLKMREREQYWILFYNASDRRFGFNYIAEVFTGRWLTNNKLEEKDVVKILDDIEKGKKRKDIAKNFNISTPTISDIASGRSWGYLKRNKIRVSPPFKISDNDVEEIKKYIKKDVKQKEIARLFNINQSTVSRIADGLRRSQIVYREAV